MSHKFFNTLNYTMANEDTKLEYDLLEEGAGHVLSIAGSGSRVLPLFAKNPKKLSIADYSAEQLALTNTRIESVRQLNYQQFLAFWGYPSLEVMTNSDRKSIFKGFCLEDNHYELMFNIFEAYEWSPLLYTGKYEKSVIKISSIVQKVLGKNIQKMINITSHSDFLEYLYSGFPHRRFKAIITMLGNSTFLNAILYKGKHPKKNINISYSKYYYNMFYSCFRFLTPREGFFMQLIFFGKIVDIKGAPFETHEDIYEKMKAGINQCEIQYYQGELFSQIEQIDTNIDFISFSDILSYFPKDLEEIYLQKIKSKLNLGAKTIHRYFFHVNKNLDIADYQKVTDNYTSNINNEKTQIYLIDIYQKD